MKNWFLNLDSGSNEKSGHTEAAESEPIDKLFKSNNDFFSSMFFRLLTDPKVM